MIVLPLNKFVKSCYFGTKYVYIFFKMKNTFEIVYDANLSLHDMYGNMVGQMDCLKLDNIYFNFLKYFNNKFFEQFVIVYSEESLEQFSEFCIPITNMLYLVEIQNLTLLKLSI